MSLTQSDLAAMTMRSPATIKAVEIGKLALSENLATLIEEATGADKKWLLENDLNSPVPPLKRASASWNPEERAYDCLCALIADLFSRLFAVCRRLQEGEGRKNLLIYIKDELEFLEKTGYEPDAIQRFRGSVDAFEFFEMHRDSLDPDLRQLVNLDFLIKDAYHAQALGENAFSKRGKNVREKESKLSPRADALSRRAKKASRKRPKPRSRTPALPSPGDQHRIPRSSSNRHDATR
jgi:transcriptional regulator with XRE-family HTH domain